VVRLLPWISFNWTVMVEVLAPFAVIDVGEAVMVDVAILAVPGLNVITSLSRMATLPTVPVMVEFPAVVEEVKVAVYVPFPLSVTVLRVPAVAANVTVAPPVVTLLPLASFN